MSVNASTRALTQLILRHLKEQGFHSAADELQRHCPQVETNASASLLDIYSSWLTDSKQKGPPGSAKRSNSVKQGRIAAKATPRKNKDKHGKSVPAKRNRGESKSAKNAKRSLTQTKDNVLAAGGDDSDSDSSLDVDKWKRLLLHMTESDVAKMDTINALDSSAPPPVKKRVRKPRARPPAKTDTLVQQSNGTVGSNEKVEEKTTTATPTKKSTPKRARPRNTTPVSSSATPSRQPNINAVKDSPATPTLSPLKQTPKKEKRKDVTPGEVKTDETTSEPKKKKKRKKEMTEEKAEETINETGGDGKDGEEEKNTEVSEQEFGDKPAEGKKKAKGTRGDGKMKETEKEMIENNTNGDVDHEEMSIVHEKTAKKKKKEKTDSEGNLEQVVDKETENSAQLAEEKKAKKKRKQKSDSEENLEQVAEKVEEHLPQIAEEKKAKKKKRKEIANCEENSEQIVEEKKKEKKHKADHHEEMSEQIVEEKKAKKKKEIANCEENLEQIVEEKKAKKKKKKENPDEENSEQIVEEKKKEKKHKADHNKETSEQIAEENTTTTKISESNDREENSKQITEVKKKKKKDSLKNNDTEPLPPPNPETPSPPTEKKKKKSKLKAAEVLEIPAASVQDDEATQTLQTPSRDTPHKKKKKLLEEQP